MRCGIIVSRYKGPVLGGAAVPPSPPPAPAPPPPMAASAVGTVFGDPVPAMAGSGTVYDGPPPGAVSGGTVYQGPAAGAPGAQRRPGMAPVLMVTQKLRFGEILGESFLIYLKNFIPFSILTAFAFSPIYLFGDYLLRRVVAEGSASKMGMALLVILATLLVCVPLSTSMITYGVFQEMRGRSASLGSCLSVGLSSLLPVFSVAFLQALFVFVGWFCTSFVVGFLIGFARASGGSSGAGCSVLLTPLIAFAFILPVMIWLRFFVAVPAAVEERPGVMEAMRRSVFLTEGQRGRIFWIVFVLAILTGGVQLGAGRVPVAGPVLQPVVGLLASSLFATTCAVIYYRLRSFHESIDVDQIASVFD
jgi:hypothetical protein